MPSFWDFVNPIIDVAQGQAPGGTALMPPVTVPQPTLTTVGGGTPPAGSGTSNLRWNPRTGRWECKRRRRRRLLTESDFNDLMRIATLPNKQNVTVALAKAVGRR